MTQQPSPDTSAIERFEHELTELIATAFGSGTIVEGEWQLTSPVSAAPAWTVTIEKIETDDESAYKPEFLEE
ncbi:hypothetical protein [Natronosalvus vescus]|uniref:hypothetical protein n=1 Tax=Natronosalvus vescus TaxID=2953881 RepID=UPI0020908477|nr:hypothetical protein [Natronosalvus vescus]